MAARFFAGLLVSWSALVAAAADPLLPTPEELHAAKTVLARQQLYCQRLVNLRRDEVEIATALLNAGAVSKDEADGADKRLKSAEQQLAQVKDGKLWQPAKAAAPASYDEALARLTREEQLAQTRFETGLTPASSVAEARRQRLRLQWTFGPEEKRAEAAAELAKVLREQLEYAAALRREAVFSDLDELGIRRELVAVLPAAEAVKERRALSEHARQSVEVLQARFVGGVISKLDVLQGACSALEALLSIETE